MVVLNFPPHSMVQVMILTVHIAHYCVDYVCTACILLSFYNKTPFQCHENRWHKVVDNFWYTRNRLDSNQSAILRQIGSCFVTYSLWWRCRLSSSVLWNVIQTTSKCIAMCFVYSNHFESFKPRASAFTAHARDNWRRIWENAIFCRQKGDFHSLFE